MITEDFNKTLSDCLHRVEDTLQALQKCIEKLQENTPQAEIRPTTIVCPWCHGEAALLYVESPYNSSIESLVYACKQCDAKITIARKHKTRFEG